MKNVSLKSYHLEFQFVSSRSCLLQWLLQWLLLITMFCFFIFQYKAKLVRKQRCKFKASFFFFFFGSETFSHFCGKLFHYTQFGQIVPYTIYNFLKIQSWCNSYEVWVRFRIRVPVWIRVRDSVIFEKIGCGCGGVRQLKHY